MKSSTDLREIVQGKRSRPSEIEAFDAWLSTQFRPPVARLIRFCPIRRQLPEALYSQASPTRNYLWSTELPTEMCILLPRNEPAKQPRPTQPCGSRMCHLDELPEREYSQRSWRRRRCRGGRRRAAAPPLMRPGVGLRCRQQSLACRSNGLTILHLPPVKRAPYAAANPAVVSISVSSTTISQPWLTA